MKWRDALWSCTTYTDSIEEEQEKVKVHYDTEVDASYSKSGNQKSDVGIEILHASKKMDIKTILSYDLISTRNLIQKIAERITAADSRPRKRARMFARR